MTAKTVLRPEVRKQLEDWLDNLYSAEVAIEGEVQMSVTSTTEQVRRLARTTGALETLLDVLRLLDGEFTEETSYFIPEPRTIVPGGI